MAEVSASGIKKEAVEIRIAFAHSGEFTQNQIEALSRRAATMAADASADLCDDDEEIVYQVETAIVAIVSTESGSSDD